MARRVGFGLLIFVGIVCFCGLAGYGFLHRFDPPTNWRNPPLYPGAQQVAVQDFGEWGKRQADTFNMYTIKVITFMTTDNPEQVKTFYAGVYTGGGWQPDTWSRKVAAKDPLSYSWSTGAQHSPSVYFVDVSTDVPPAGGTHVEIGVSMFPGY